MSFYSLEKDGITQGLLCSWRDCREKASLFLQGYTQNKTSMGLTYGTIVHSILEKAYRSISKGEIKNFPTEKQVKHWVSIVEKEWEKENPRASREELSNKETSCLIAEATLPSYFDYWRKDFKELKWLSIEEEFKIPYENKTLLRGKFDGVYERKGKLWLFETKAKSMIREGVLVDTLPMDFQVNFYLYCLKRIYKRIPAGVKYNVVRRIGLEQRKKETIKQYVKRCVEDVESRPEFYFLRFESIISNEEMNKFEEELKKQINEFIFWFKTKDNHYRNPNQCETKYGACWALGLCSGSSVHLYSKRKTVFKELEDM